MAEIAEIKTIPIEDLYTRWGDDYDNRGLNNMQVLDDVEMTVLLPKLLSLIPVSHSAPISRSSTSPAARAVPR